MKRQVIFLLIAVCLIPGACNEAPESMIKDAEKKKIEKEASNGDGSFNLEIDDEWQGEFEFAF